MAQSTEAILETALKGLLAEQARIEKKVRVLKSALAAVSASETEPARRLRRPMSAAERRAASKRMKAFWAKQKSGSVAKS